MQTNMWLNKAYFDYEGLVEFVGGRRAYRPTYGPMENLIRES